MSHKMIFYKGDRGQPSVFAIRHSVIFLFDCHGTSQSIDKGISEVMIMKKILETSYGKMLNLLYSIKTDISSLSSNYDCQLINQVHQIKFRCTWFNESLFNI